MASVSSPCEVASKPRSQNSRMAASSAASLSNVR